MPTPLRLTMALGAHAHTAALRNGSIPIDGIAPEFVTVEPQIAAYRRMVRDLAFDVCEIAPSTYMIAREHGVAFKALPIFVSRNFHHAGFVCRPDAGIHTPRDLEGKNAGVRAYSVTTGIWTRGILQHEYGVDIARITWWVDDEEHVTTLELPAFVKHVAAGKSLVSMMAAGELQAAFTGPAGLGRTGAPKDDWSSGAADTAATDYVELFADARALEAEWYRRTGIYPFHGTLVVRESVLKAHPWVARSLLRAYTSAKEAYLQQFPEPDRLSEKDRSIAELAAIVGDPLPYGIAPNRASIEALIRYVHEQGMLRQHYAVADMFVDPEAT